MATRHRIDRLLSIQEIKANPRNARTHSKAQIRQIAESIKAFGFGAPVLVDETLTLICGFGRLKAAERLNIAEIPAVQLLGLSEAQKRALALADNKIAGRMEELRSHPTVKPIALVADGCATVLGAATLSWILFRAQGRPLWRPSGSAGAPMPWTLNLVMSMSPFVAGKHSPGKTPWMLRAAGPSSSSRNAPVRSVPRARAIRAKRMINNANLNEKLRWRANQTDRVKTRSSD
jgi:ParB-like nuclease domain